MLMSVVSERFLYPSITYKEQNDFCVPTQSTELMVIAAGPEIVLPRAGVRVRDVPADACMDQSCRRPDSSTLISTQVCEYLGV